MKIGGGVSTQRFKGEHVCEYVYSKQKILLARDVDARGWGGGTPEEAESQEESRRPQRVAPRLCGVSEYGGAQES